MKFSRLAQAVSAALLTAAVLATGATTSVANAGVVPTTGGVTTHDTGWG
ncbi:MAG: hypothetical protein ABIN79_03025 [Marmoricola sp.]